MNIDQKGDFFINHKPLKEVLIMSNLLKVNDKINDLSVLSGTIKSIVSNLSPVNDDDNEDNKKKIIRTIDHDPNINYVKELVKKDEKLSKTSVYLTSDTLIDRIAVLKQQYRDGKVTLINLLKEYQSMMYSVIKILENHVLKKSANSQNTIFKPMKANIKV